MIVLLQISFSSLSSCFTKKKKTKTNRPSTLFPPSSFFCQLSAPQNLHTQLPTCVCLPTLRTSLPAAVVTGAAATFFPTSLTLTVLWWQLRRERLDGPRGTTFDPAGAANQTCCSHLHRPFQTREPCQLATPPPLAASCPVLTSASSLPSSSRQAVAVLPSFSLSPSPLSPPPPSIFSLPPSCMEAEPPLGAVGGCLSLLSIRPRPRPRPVTGSTSNPPPIWPAVSVRASQCRQGHLQCTVRLYSRIKHSTSVKAFYAIIDSNQLTLAPRLIRQNQQKKAPRLVAARLPSLPAEDLLVQPLGCSRYLITPQLVGSVLCSLSHQLRHPSLHFSVALLVLLMHALCIPHCFFLSCSLCFLYFDFVGNRHTTPPLRRLSVFLVLLL